jgi:hypothetical protein
VVNGNKVGRFSQVIACRLLWSECRFYRQLLFINPVHEHTSNVGYVTEVILCLGYLKYMWSWNAQHCIQTMMFELEYDDENFSGRNSVMSVCVWSRNLEKGRPKVHPGL